MKRYNTNTSNGEWNKKRTRKQCRISADFDDNNNTKAVSTEASMYYTGEFKYDRSLASVPIVWTFMEKGNTKCYWPVRNLSKHLQKRTPPPLNGKENGSWKIFEVTILLNKKIFRSLELADQQVDRMVSANKTFEKESSTSAVDSDALRFCTKNQTFDIPQTENVDVGLQVVQLSGDKIHGDVAIESRCVGVQVAQVSCSEIRDGLLIESRDVGLQVDAGRQEIPIEDLHVSEERKIISVKINDPDKFANLERDLLNETKSDIVANCYLSRICQNIENEYMQQMVLETFEIGFLKNISFKKERNRIFMKGTNVMKCWIKTIKKKFYVKCHELTAKELEQLDENIADKIQAAIRTIKNSYYTSERQKKNKC